MAWRETSPGKWQRPLGENERMIKWIGDRAYQNGREQWSISVYGSLVLPRWVEQNHLVAKLRRAWMLLRFRHPSIAATAEADILEYRIPDDALLEDWADKTLRVISDPTIEADGLISSLKPSPFTTAYFLTSNNTLVLHTGHWRTDGTGAFQLLNAFFEALAFSEANDLKVAWGEETSKLTPAIEEALGLPKDPTEDIEAASAACFATGAHVMGSVGLPYRKSAGITAENTRMFRRTLSEDMTTSVLAACSKRNLKPSAAVHAALATANILGSTSLSPAGHSARGDGHYTSTMRFNLRPYLNEQFSSDRYAAALASGNYMARVDAGQSWDDKAVHYSSLYEAGLNESFLSARRLFAARALDMMQKVAGGKQGHQRSEVDISIVEDVDELVVSHRRWESSADDEESAVLEVKDVGLGIECLTPESYLVFWIFRGKLEFNMVYNEAFYHVDFMENMLNSVVAALVGQDGLQIG
ncbi:hypothetical protein F5B18DRAFT_491583 [Nemania serpens]|nr:hypothetical protein F5B18DRAFT_491583 [Nemania serpens]